MIDDSRDLLEAVLGSEAFAEVARAARDYEFNVALELLRHRAMALEIEL